MARVLIVNVVATATLGQRVGLEELGKCSQITHDQEIYGGRVAYFRSPKFNGERARNDLEEMYFSVECSTICVYLMKLKEDY